VQKALLNWAGLNPETVVSIADRRESSLNQLADVLAEHLAPDWLQRWGDAAQCGARLQVGTPAW
jgi:cobyric acid synthase